MSQGSSIAPGTIAPSDLERDVAEARIIAALLKALNPHAYHKGVSEKVYFAIWAAAHGCDVVGVDISIRAIQFAEYNAEHASNRRQIGAAGGTICFKRSHIHGFADGYLHPHPLADLDRQRDPDLNTDLDSYGQPDTHGYAHVQRDLERNTHAVKHQQPEPHTHL